MNSPPRKIAERGLFRPVWVEFNRLLDYVREISPSGGRNIRQTRTLNGTLSVAEPPAGGDPGATLRQVRIKEHGNDWMRCRSWNGTIEGTTDIYVARDPELRRTRFDGKTIAYSSDGDVFSATFAYTSPTKRTKTIGGVAEEQVIDPYYVIDSVITEASNSTIINCIRSSDPTGVNDPDGKPITLVEVTQRAWAKLDTSSLN